MKTAVQGQKFSDKKVPEIQGQKQFTKKLLMKKPVKIYGRAPKRIFRETSGEIRRGVPCLITGGIPNRYTEVLDKRFSY